MVLLPWAAFAGDAHWTLLNDKSSIEWVVNYGGKPLAGSFPAFSSDIVFDPAHLDKSSVNISVEMVKVTSTDKDARENLPAEEWFASKKYPLAIFKSTSFRNIKGDDYEAEGVLTIKGKPVKVTLPFSVKFAEDKTYAVMNGELIIKRLDFGIGTGEWQKTDTMANDVKVTVHVEAKPG
jgi:polyisoprenoid-binding protein YceI